MENCLRSWYISYIVRKNYPFSDDISRVFVRFREAGLTIKWYQSIIQALTRYKGDKGEDEENFSENCTLKGLSFCFYMLLLGYIFGGCVLLLEFYISNKQKHRIR